MGIKGMRTMYDAVNAGSIPITASLVAGYVNGVFEWSSASWGRFPHATHVGINVTGNLRDGGTILDVERFDATVENIPDWVRGREAEGEMHGIYIERSNLILCQDILKEVGIPTAVWCADWTKAEHQVQGCVAVQYLPGLRYDVSAVYNPGWHPTL
jgi:hypothetical protein